MVCTRARSPWCARRADYLASGACARVSSLHPSPLLTPMRLPLAPAAASGVFFSSPPICDFGGTLLAYCCYFGALDAIRRLLSDARMSAIVDLNRDCCMRTGFLPVHAAVAGSQVATYSFLVTLPGVPGRLRKLADPTMLIVPPADSGHMLQLTALQLAFWRGDKATTQFLIEQRSYVEWRWGPLSSVITPLAEIDSAGQGSNDLLQLICSHDAPVGAQEMILDSFMGGMLFELVMEKWHLFAQRQHYIRSLLTFLCTPAPAARSCHPPTPPPPSTAATCRTRALATYQRASRCLLRPPLPHRPARALLRTPAPASCLGSTPTPRSSHEPCNLLLLSCGCWCLRLRRCRLGSDDVQWLWYQDATACR